MENNWKDKLELSDKFCRLKTLITNWNIIKIEITKSNYGKGAHMYVYYFADQINNKYGKDETLVKYQLLSSFKKKITKRWNGWYAELNIDDHLMFDYEQRIDDHYKRRGFCWENKYLFLKEIDEILKELEQKYNLWTKNENTAEIN